MDVRSSIAVMAALGSMVAVGAWTGHGSLDASRHPVSYVAQDAQGMKWTATLDPMNGSTVKGTASLAPGKTGGTSVATISITGGTPGAVYPWHIHTGKCGGGGVLGSGAAYKPVKVGSDGSGTSTADLSVAAPTTGDYHVNVHASPTDMKTIAACGELAMAGM